MSKNYVYGNEIEIKAFAEMYNVNIIVQTYNSNVIHSFGNNSSNLKLTLLFDGKFDAGHYEISNYCNDNMKPGNLKFKEYTCKQKINSVNDEVKSKKSLMDNEVMNLMNKNNDYNELDYKDNVKKCEILKVNSNNRKRKLSLTKDQVKSNYCNSNVSCENLKNNTCKRKIKLINDEVKSNESMMEQNRVKIKIIGDENCLFRCFAHYLYNDQNLHSKLRNKIVQNIVDNWQNYENFIVGNIYYKNVLKNKTKDILNSNDYKNYMLNNYVYGNEIEIKSFVEMYNVHVTVYMKNLNNIHSFGNDKSNLKLTLLFDGNFDVGHYDIIDYNDNDKRFEILKVNNKNFKRKINDQVTSNKRQKLKYEYKGYKQKKKIKHRVSNCKIRHILEK